MIQSSATIAEFPSALRMASFLCPGTKAYIRPTDPDDAIVNLREWQSSALKAFGLEPGNFSWSPKR